MREFRLIGGIGESLGFKAQTRAVWIGDAAFSFNLTIEEITTIELDAGLIGEDLHHASA